MSDNNVIHCEFRDAHSAENEMVTQLKDLIYSFAGRVSIASTFGVLEIVKQDLIREVLP